MSWKTGLICSASVISATSARITCGVWYSCSGSTTGVELHGSVIDGPSVEFCGSGKFLTRFYGCRGSSFPQNQKFWSRKTASGITSFLAVV
jgi:hypothetical protein